MQILLDEKAFIRGRKYGEVPEKFRLNGRYLLHEYALLEADMVSLVHRRNARTHIRFMVPKQHKTAENANEYILRRTLSVPPQLCKVSFVMEAPEAYGLRFDLENAGIRNVGAWTDHLTSWIEYEVLGGKLKAA